VTWLIAFLLFVASDYPPDITTSTTVETTVPAGPHLPEVL
jgi:hypothetical protein